MKSFHTTQKLSLMILGLGMIVSADAVAAINITQADCDTVFADIDETFLL